VVKDDVRLGGAIADVGPTAGLHAREIGELIEQNRQDVGRVTGRSANNRSKRRKR
jgi:hypothetical protein